MKNKKFLAGATLAAFATTLVPMAAFAATTVSADASFVATVKKDVNTEVNEAVDVVITLNDAAGTRVTTGQNVYVWAEATNKTGQATDAVKEGKIITVDAGKFENGAAEFEMTFLRAGEYVLKASLDQANAGTKDATNLLSSPTGNNKITVEAAAGNGNDWKAVVGDKEYADGEEVVLAYAANGKSNEVVFNLVDKNGQPIANQEVKIDTNSNNVTVSDEKVTTNYNGEAKFKLSSETEGTYTVSLVADKFDVDFKVTFGAGSAVRLETKKAPENAVAVDKNPVIEIVARDINGNVVNTIDGLGDYTATITKAPAKSKLEDKEVALVKGTGDFFKVDFGANTPDKEGNYELTVSLDNGKTVKIAFEAKELAEIAKMELEYDVNALELGANSGVVKVIKTDVNGVVVEESAADAKVDLGVSGSAVASFDAKTGEVKIKDDEKYVGQKITVTAVDKKNNLVANYVFTVAEQAEGLSFASNQAQVNVNNKIQYSVVDAKGNKVALGTDVTVEANAFVIEQPEGAKASVTVKAEDLKTKGVDTLTVTSAKEGIVKVQVMIKATGKDGVSNYYTGVAEINFGKEAVKGGEVVTMFIGSTSFMVNGEAKTMDVAPFVKDNRTFVPVRAFGEALGAKVEYDEATQVITAEKDGMTVTMTVGSNVITTSKGETITADVAAFVKDGRTVLPLRAAAEAFGCDVEAISNVDGTTAGVIFTVK